jgi:Xaa-Pro aminopeptidase
MENDSITEYRYTFLAHLLDEHKLDALVVSHLTHIRYLTGFTGSNALLLITRRNRYIVTDSRYEVQVHHEVTGWKISIAKNDLIGELKRKNFLRNASRIGFESRHMSFLDYRRIESLLPGRRWIGLHHTVEPLLLEKEEHEIAAIRKAISVSEKVFNEILPMIKPGVAEVDIAAEITCLHRRYGAERDAFDTIVASGPRAALPHGRASEKKIQHHELVLLDFGCVVNGYHSDITRMVATGTVDPEAEKCYAIVRDAARTAMELVRDQASCKKVDKAARDYVRTKGFGEYFKHSLGHGIGLDIHESPRISPFSDERLVAGATITVEPGVYIPDRFGIRIEDDVLVTQDAYEIMTTLSTELILL